MPLTLVFPEGFGNPGDDLYDLVQLLPEYQHYIAGRITEAESHELFMHWMALNAVWIS